MEEEKESARREEGRGEASGGAQTQNRSSDSLDLPPLTPLHGLAHPTTWPHIIQLL